MTQRPSDNFTTAGYIRGPCGSEPALFTFTGYLRRRRFLVFAALSIALYVASVALFPFLLLGLASLSGCRNVGGACGALGLVASTALKPLAYALFVFSLIGPSLRRARDAGLPAFTGLLVPLLFAADYTLVYIAAPWSFAFSQGVLWASFPKFALLALVCIGVLAALPSRERAQRNPFGLVGWVAFALGSYVAFFTALAAAGGAPGLLYWLRPFLTAAAPALRPATRILPYVMVAFAAALVCVVWQAWRNPPAAPVREVPPKSSPGARLIMPAAVAFALAMAIFAISQTSAAAGGASLVMLLTVALTPIVLPTFLLYLAPVWSAVWFFRGHRVGGAIAFAIATLPFVHWAYAHRVHADELAREQAEIASIPTSRATHVPPVLVYDSRDTSGLRGVWALPAIERVISRGAYGQRLMQFERPSGRSRQAANTTIEALPETYLLLKVGRASSFAKERVTYAGAGGPLELRLVDSDGDRLIAVWYRVFNPPPPAIPVLSTGGWFRGGNTFTADQLTSRIADFLTTALPQRTALGK